MHVLIIAGLIIAGVEIFVSIVLVLITATTVKLPIFWLIQFISINLEFAGWFICLSPRLAKDTWIYWNDDDPPTNLHWWDAYLWLAWRNPVDNFKHVKWTQRSGPLVYKTWVWWGKQFYYKAGWMSDSYCCLSAGGGRGF